MLAAALSASAAWSLQGPPLDRRAVLSGALTTAALAPMPAFAKSKEKAKEQALQKETAKEAKQAMKEYKTAPRPELVGNAETGYSYKADTVKAGSTGELATYFKDKGDKVQATYAAENARAKGASSADAQKMAEQLEAKLVEYRHPDPYTRACLRLPAPPIFFVAHLRLWIFCRKVLSGCCRSPFRDTFASCLTLIPVFLAQSRTCPAAASTCATRTTAWACRRR